MPSVPSYDSCKLGVNNALCQESSFVRKWQLIFSPFETFGVYNVFLIFLIFVMQQMLVTL
jgi:hypothetical protein